MGKTFSYIVFFTGLLFMVVGIPGLVKLVKRDSSPTLQQSDRDSARALVLALLQAHSGRGDRDWTTRFSQKGTQRYAPLSISSQRFERKLSFASNGPIVRYDKSIFDKSQSYLFDGNSLVRTTLQAGTQTEVKQTTDVEARSIKFQIATFGLIPVLKRLSDPSTKVFYLGPTTKGDRFEVKTVNGSWYFYTNSNHLIDRLEVGEINITYGDYRTVAGLTLPFKQYVREGERFLYEINFDTFLLNPVFAPDFFKS